jgi:hypothetical protein
MRTLKDVARLSPLPSVDDTFMVYTRVGLLKDGTTAVFLLASDAKATGDGTCKPSKDDCESVEVGKRDTEFFDLTVDVLRNAHLNATNRFKGASSYRWLPERDVLVRAPKHGSAQASVTVATAASAADAAALLPGRPVWHWKLGG